MSVRINTKNPRVCMVGSAIVKCGYLPRTKKQSANLRKSARIGLGLAKIRENSWTRIYPRLRAVVLHGSGVLFSR
jgi:hypothetical protein